MVNVYQGNTGLLESDPSGMVEFASTVSQLLALHRRH